MPCMCRKCGYKLAIDCEIGLCYDCLVSPEDKNKEQGCENKCRCPN